MLKIILLLALLATLIAAGATAFRLTTRRQAQLEPVDPAILTEHLQKLCGEEALP
jgi:hypothetical protein